MSNFDLNSVEECDEEVTKHRCKLCNKSFPCGRSLGGHMRSHVINDNGGNFVANINIDVTSNSTDLGYELRKDPKKSTKANDFALLDKLCKECGKGFQSWKALFGHMKCHSDKVSNSKTAVLNHCLKISRPDNEDPKAKKSQTKKSRSRNGTTHAIISTPTASSSVSMNANNASTSVVSETDQEQDVEIAMCLIMLSRDVGEGGENETIIGNSCKLKKLAEADAKVALDVGFDRLEKPLIDQDELGQSKRKFECTTCNKSFLTYQALGGHRTSHKKLKGCFDIENRDKNMIKSEPMLDQNRMVNRCCEKTQENHRSSSSFDLGNSLKTTMVVGAHECSICSKVFSSGQALGGHKRSHVTAEAKQNQRNPSLIEKFEKPVHEIRCFLDLNMPPDVEDEQEQETYTGYSPWCYDHEPKLLGLLSTS